MGTGRKTVVVGQVIDPVVWGNPLWDQSVQVFASAADRTTQFPAPLKGAVTFLEDVGRLELWTGTAWSGITGPWLLPALLTGISDSVTLGGLRYQVLGGALRIAGAFSGTAASAYAVCTFPVGARPIKPARIWASAGGYAQVGIDGTMTSSIAGVKTDVSVDGVVPLT